MVQNMEKGLTVPQSVPNIQNVSAQAQKFGILMKKRLHLASVVSDFCFGFVISKMFDDGALTRLIFLSGLLIMDYYEKIFEQYLSLINQYIYFPQRC